jgi:signal transduction histidine kinase/DNA-binding NarL/FixJ family response regulator/HPt (histidine-containing phosphotransfer) domain-containing protein
MSHRPTRILIVAMGLLVAALVTMSAMIASNLRHDALRNAEIDLNRHTLTLAAQAERSLQSVDLILSNISDHLTTQGVFDSASYLSAMQGQETYKFLKEKLAGLPQLEAITMIDADGKLINFSRYWPIPDVNISDRDYFIALSNSPDKMNFVSLPVQNRGTGTWNIYIARRVNGINGSFAGLILAAMSLQYYEDFYKSISLGEGSAQSLVRDDGTMLARYPATREIGKIIKSDMRWASKPGQVNTIRQMSPIDREIRVKSAKMLANSPLFILTTRSESSILQPWRKTMKLLAGFTGAMIVLALLAATMIVRKWKQQELLAKAEAERADAELAKSMVETELLREQERTAEAANRAKSNFLAMMSHEIRTPMNAVIGLTGVLLETELSRDQRSSVEAIHSAGDNLLHILNDILDFSRLEAGNLSMEEVPFDPSTLIATTLAIVGPSAEAKGLSIAVEAAGDLPRVLFGDPARIRQILLNLLSNAIKFTSQGGITITVDCTQLDDEFARMHWSVTDTGLGIPADRIEALFNDFVQVDSSVSRRFGGSGLGLAICRRIAGQMGGQIGVTSELGLGSTFAFDLKLPIAAELSWDNDDGDAVIEHLKGRVTAIGRALRILVVDDNAMNRMVVAKMLAGFDVAITEACDGLQAIEIVSDTVFDVILMDMQMPNMDGLTATAAIRAGGGWHQSVPIIAFTANAFAEDRQVCLDAGMTDFVAKPVRKQRLVRALLSALSLNELEGHTAEPAMCDIAKTPSIVAALPEADASRFDPSWFLTLQRELGASYANEVYAVFIEDTRRRFQLFASSDIAVARDIVEIEAHSLKSAAAMFGLTGLAGLAVQLEREARQISEADFRALVHRLQGAFERENSEFEQCFGVGGDATRAAASG